MNSIFIASSTMTLSPAPTRCPGSTATCHTLAIIGDRTASHPSGIEKPQQPRRTGHEFHRRSMRVPEHVLYRDTM